jgi:hypothetical protein
MTPELYATHWFITVFVDTLPPAVVVRIWDIYLKQGRKCIYRIVLAIMKINQARLMECRDMSEAFLVFKGMSSTGDVD